MKFNPLSNPSITSENVAESRLAYPLAEFEECIHFLSYLLPRRLTGRLFQGAGAALAYQLRAKNGEHDEGLAVEEGRMTAPVRGSDFSHAMRLCAPASDPIETALPVAEIADVAPPG
ncbi:hypothetical protein [Aeromonas sp.]|uniref:hypothetical protein n=1 Tax=Aeromonas sp. TaxID=647 RepID=UPI002590A6EF|nr:hypothetical protein [Aeromonas sp.]MCX7130805.1 hypothetical protein [Aeromonas sp.]